MSDGFRAVTVSLSGAPDIEFKFEGATCRAELDGAVLYAELRGDKGIDMRLSAKSGEILADIVLNTRFEVDDTQNVTDVGSALLWSNWRYERAKAPTQDSLASQMAALADEYEATGKVNNVPMLVRLMRAAAARMRGDDV